MHPLDCFSYSVYVFTSTFTSMSGYFLIDASVGTATAAKYSRAVRRFIEWCDEQHYDINSDEEMDEYLTIYFHEMYGERDGGGKSIAADTFFGILKYCPRYHDRLHSAYASLRGWQRLHASVPYPPLTWELTVLIATTMAVNGYRRHAFACLLAFDCFLRVGELVNIRYSDIATTADRRIGAEYRGVAIRLRHTKTGANQWVQVENEELQRQLLLLLRASVASQRDTRIFAFTAASFRSIFKRVCACLRLSATYVPHSLRHGGATRWHLLGHSVDDILIRGRWASTTSARRYIQAGRALLLTVHVPVSISIIARRLTTAFTLTLSLLSLSQSHYKRGVE